MHLHATTACRSHVSRHIVRHISFPGEIALFNDAPRSASVYARRDGGGGVAAWMITRAEFKAIFCDDDDRAKNSAGGLVIVCAPGDGPEDELALVLARALSDMKRVARRRRRARVVAVRPWRLLAKRPPRGATPIKTKRPWPNAYNRSYHPTPPRGAM